MYQRKTVVDIYKELEEIKKTEHPHVRIHFNISTDVVINLETGFVVGRPPHGLTFNDIRSIASSEIENGIWDGERCIPFPKITLEDGEVLCSGIAIFCNRASRDCRLFFRLWGSRWNRSGAFWAQYGSARKPIEVKEALDNGRFEQLSNLRGVRIIAGLHVTEKEGQDGKIYPEITLTKEDGELLKNFGTPGKFDPRPYIPFSKEIFWAKRPQKKFDTYNY